MICNEQTNKPLVHKVISKPHKKESLLLLNQPIIGQFSHKAMDLSSPKFFRAPQPLLFPSTAEPPIETNPSFQVKNKGNPFAVADTFADPLCKLNLKETSEFVKSFPVAVNNNSISAQKSRDGVYSSATQKRIIEAPSTPGRPVFSFSVGNFSRKNVPSKWDDAEKWLNTTSCHDSPAHPIKPVPIPESSNNQKKVDNFNQQMMVFSEKSRVTDEKVSKVVSCFPSSMYLDHHNSARPFNGVSGSTDILLKDKFANKVESVLPNLRCSSEPSKEGFPFRNTNSETMKDVGTEVIHEVQHRDVGTEMTPQGSSTVSRCHTPFKSSSPPRHNTPNYMSGPLALGHSNSTNSNIDISQLHECHLAKLQLGTQYDSVTSNWSSREEEEEEISKSLRHFETGSVPRKSVSDSRAAAWEEEEKTKCCRRYQREEAKIQAWINLQSAKAEAQSKKLEVKIQKMRSNLEEKLMKRMAVVHRRAEEWRASAAGQHHVEQTQKATAQAKKIINRHNNHISGHGTCGCFPCSNSYH